MKLIHDDIFEADNLLDIPFKSLVNEAEDARDLASQSIPPASPRSSYQASWGGGGAGGEGELFRCED